MKTMNLSKVLKGMMLITMTLVLANCAKSSKSSNNNVNQTSYSTNICRVAQTGQQVDNSSCLNSPNSTYFQCQSSTGGYVPNQNCHVTTNNHNIDGNYQLLNNLCYQNNGGYLQQVDISVCYNQNNGNYGQQVVNCSSGTYYYYNQVIQCGITHTCPSGLIMQNQSGQTIRCQ